MASKNTVSPSLVKDPKGQRIFRIQNFLDLERYYSHIPYTKWHASSVWAMTPLLFHTGTSAVKTVETHSTQGEPTQEYK